ncbi:hypothetical protein CFP56_040578 [Quercus suber]|uniref:Uncharacterized protein n=1 Tax=Quercus suber TaxID=58331 RepID=A0AAW0LNB8_QUESU
MSGASSSIMVHSFLAIRFIWGWGKDRASKDSEWSYYYTNS